MSNQLIAVLGISLSNGTYVPDSVTGDFVMATVTASNNLRFGCEGVPTQLCVTSTQVAVSNLSVSGGIVPSQNHVQNLGASSARFNTAYVDTLSAGALVASNGGTFCNGLTVATGSLTAGGAVLSGALVATSGATFCNGLSVATGALTAAAANLQTIASANSNTAISIGSDSNTTSVSIGCSSYSNTINVGTGAGSTVINLGGASDTVNIAGTTTIVNTTSIAVADPLITINKGGAAASAGGTGLEIEENAAITGYIKVTSDRNGFLFKSPAGAEATLNLVGGIVGFNSNALVLSNSMVGAGTSNPSANLHVSSSNASALLRVTASNAFNSDFAVAGTAGSYLTGSLVGDACIRNFTGCNVLIGYGTTPLLSVMKTGYVGIGNVSPSYPLHVTGAIYATGDITALSDGRYKKDRAVIGSALDKVSRLTGYTYRLEHPEVADEPGKRRAGLIAQDLQQVLAEAVSQDDKGDLSVSYGNVVALLVEAIKELDQRTRGLGTV